MFISYNLNKYIPLFCLISTYLHTCQIAIQDRIAFLSESQAHLVNCNMSHSSSIVGQKVEEIEIQARSNTKQALTNTSPLQTGAITEWIDKSPICSSPNPKSRATDIKDSTISVGIYTRADIWIYTGGCYQPQRDRDASTLHATTSHK